jgi:hypothetical protein
MELTNLELHFLRRLLGESWISLGAVFFGPKTL